MEDLKNVADGIHDAAGAIQSLLDRSGMVCIPAGRYLITHPLIIHAPFTVTCPDLTRPSIRDREKSG